MDLIDKGVAMTDLLRSKIFNHTFDFDEWPTTSSDTTKMIEPYNNSMFKLRFEYPKIFNKIHAQALQ